MLSAGGVGWGGGSLIAYHGLNAREMIGHPIGQRVTTIAGADVIGQEGNMTPPPKKKKTVSKKHLQTVPIRPLQKKKSENTPLHYRS